MSKSELARSVIAAGGLEHTRSGAKRYYEKAARVIGRLEITKEKRSRLTEILDKAYNGTKK